MAQSPSMVIRIAADLSELQAQLKTGAFAIEQTTAKMVNFANSYSGARTVQNAADVQKAIELVGGATMLTAKEQASANRILEEGLAKYRALGREAPAGMQQLADETKKVDTVSGGLTTTVKQLAAGFAAMFTARAAFNFVKGTVAEASALKDLAQQTHINVEELQILAGAMSEFGVDADTLGKGLFTLSRKISKGDDSVSDALKQMGMELTDVKGLNGEELFTAIMRGLSNLQGGLRDETASELFGSRLGMAMAGASEDIDDTMATWRELNTVMSTETVDALDTADESIKRMNQSLSMVAANLMGPVAEGFNVLFNATQKGMSNWDYFVANTKDLTASLLGTGSGTENLTRLLDGLNQKTEAAKTATAGHAKAHREFVPAVEDTTGATKRARDGAAALAKAHDDAAKDAAKLTAEMEKFTQSGLIPADKMLGQVTKTLEPLPAATAAWRSDLVLTAETIETAVVPALAEMEAEIAAVSLSFSDAMALVAAGQGTMTGTVSPDLSAAGKASTQKAWDEGRYYGPVLGGTPQNPHGTGPDFAALGYKAMGGPVSAGSPYMVGERGPELFVPERSGTIVPNGGGNVTLAPVIHFHGPVMGSAGEFRAMVSEALLDVWRLSGHALPGRA